MALGDPQTWPHIARATGTLSALLEGFFVRWMGRTVFSGAVFWFGVCGTVVGAYAAVRVVLSWWIPAAAWMLDVAVVYQTIAARDLDRHARAVLYPLLSGDLKGARTRLSYIVGRDTAHLDAPEISRAAVEAVAESTTDGVLAPLFWAVVGGPAAALLYRVSNTLDSIVGHRDERYELFGKWSARADDLLNYVPARVCAIFSLLTRGLRRIGPVVREARLHASPNAGWSESAAAHALDLRLGGVNSYQGAPHPGPVFNAGGRSPAPRDVLRVLRWFWTVTACATLASVLFLEWRRIRELRAEPPLFPQFTSPDHVSNP